MRFVEVIQWKSFFNKIVLTSTNNYNGSNFQQKKKVVYYDSIPDVCKFCWINRQPGKILIQQESGGVLQSV